MFENQTRPGAGCDVRAQYYSIFLQSLMEDARLQVVATGQPHLLIKACQVACVNWLLHLSLEPDADKME